MPIIEYARGVNHYDRLKDLVEVCNYHDFPTSLMVYGESLRGSMLKSVNDVAFFRCSGKTATLLAWFCCNDVLLQCLDEMALAGYNIKSFAFTHNDKTGLRTKNMEYEYFATSDWSLDDVSSESARRIRRVKEATAEYDIVDVCIDAALAFHQQWVDAAKQRHFMVVKGYSESFIRIYDRFENNLELYGWHDGSQLAGLVGYEVFGDCAQIVVMKHVTHIKNFGQFMWIELLQYLLANGTSIIYCGRSADTLKQRLRMSKVRSWKVIYG